MMTPESYETWLALVPAEITGDSLWKMKAYRLGLFAYEYALGSARESRTWYFNGRHVLGEAITTHRLKLLTEIIRLILAMVSQQRGGLIREKRASYRSRTNQGQPGLTPNREELESLLQHIPYPD